MSSRVADQGRLVLPPTSARTTEAAPQRGPWPASEREGLLSMQEEYRKRFNGQGLTEIMQRRQAAGRQRLVAEDWARRPTASTWTFEDFEHDTALGEARRLEDATNDGYMSSARRMNEFSNDTGLERLLCFSADQRRLSRHLGGWFVVWWRATRASNRTGTEGKMLGSTIIQASQQICDLHQDCYELDTLDFHKGVVRGATAHDKLLLDVFGTREVRKRACMTNEILVGFHAIGWRHAILAKDPTLSPEDVDALQLECEKINAAAVTWGMRGKNLLRGNKGHMSFHPSYDLSWGSIHLYDVRGKPQTITLESIQLLEVQGGRCEMDSKPAKDDPLGKKWAAHPRMCKIYPKDKSPHPHRDFGAVIIAGLRRQLETNPHWDQEDRQQQPLFVDPRTGEWFRKSAFMVLYYILMSAVLKHLYDQEYAQKVLEYFFGFHTYRSQYLNDMDGASAPLDVANLCGQWSETSRARHGYTRARVNQILECQEKAASQTEGPTLPGVFHEVEARLQSKRNAAASGEAVEAMPKLPPNVPRNSPVALAYEAQRQALGKSPSFRLPTTHGERTARPVELLHRTVALNSLDRSIPIERRMLAFQTGSTPILGEIAEILDPEEEDTVGDYEVLVVFQSPTSIDEHVTEVFAASLVPLCEYDAEAWNHANTAQRGGTANTHTPIPHEQFAGGAKAGQCKVKCKACKALKNMAA